MLQYFCWIVISLFPLPYSSAETALSSCLHCKKIDLYNLFLVDASTSELVWDRGCYSYTRRWRWLSPSSDTQRKVEDSHYLNVSARSSAGTLLCGSNCPFSVCLVVPSLFFISSEDWLSFKKKKEEKFFNIMLKEFETSFFRTYSEDL